MQSDRISYHRVPAGSTGARSPALLSVMLGAGLAIGGVTLAQIAFAAAPASPAAAENPAAIARPAGAPAPIVVAACNPCAAKKACSPCNPCAAKKASNPCAAKKACNPCAAKKACSPCNPCAAKKACGPCNPCAAKSACGACNPCSPCGGGAVSSKCAIPRLVTAALCNPCAAKKACSPCNPCAAKACNPCAAKKACSPCNPCAAKKACNPCAAKKACNPCAAKKACSPCNPCAAKKACNPCNPCAAKSACGPCNPCSPCGAAEPVELTAAEARAAYDCLLGDMRSGYAKSGLRAAKNFSGWSNYATQPYVSATHGSRYVNNYGNSLAADYAKYEDVGRMPVGAVLAKDSFLVRGDGKVAPGPLFLMEKMPANFNAESANWRYTMVMPDGSVFGETNGKNSAGMKFCFECHAAVAEDQDSLFFLPEEYRKH